MSFTISDMDFQFLAIWAAQSSKGKNPIMNSGQLLNSFFSCFHGQMNQKYCGVSTKKLHKVATILKILRANC